MPAHAPNEPPSISWWKHLEILKAMAAIEAVLAEQTAVLTEPEAELENGKEVAKK